jgi:hypothetical protein
MKFIVAFEGADEDHLEGRTAVKMPKVGWCKVFDGVVWLRNELEEKENSFESKRGGSRFIDRRARGGGWGASGVWLPCHLRLKRSLVMW